MIEYHTLKVEFNNGYATNKSTKSLIDLLSSFSKNDKDISEKLVKKSIKDSTNPVEFLEKIKKGIK